MAYTFAGIGAALRMDVEDYYPEGKTGMVRLREKGGKRKTVAVHHVLEGYLDSYISAAGIGEAKGTPLFRTARGKTGQLTENRMEQADAWRMLQRRAKAAGLTTRLGNHTWRATGITNYLEHGGALEMEHCGRPNTVGPEQAVAAICMRRFRNSSQHTIQSVCPKSNSFSDGLAIALLMEARNSEGRLRPNSISLLDMLHCWYETSSILCPRLDRRANRREPNQRT